MPNIKRYEQQFLDTLKDIFIGAKVEGDSGYINLCASNPVTTPKASSLNS